MCLIFCCWLAAEAAALTMGMPGASPAPRVLRGQLARSGHKERRAWPDLQVPLVLPALQDLRVQLVLSARPAPPA